MASSINPNNIDTAYPVAGQDNDSQGFRDNFSNIQTSLAYAKSEIEDLQAKVILKSALSGTALDNDFDGALITSPKVIDLREARVAIGATSGTVSIDIANGSLHTLTATGSVTLTFDNIPATGNVSNFAVEITISNTAHTLTLPAEVTQDTDGILGLSSSTITFAETGTYTFAFTTDDGGSVYRINDLTRPRTNIRVDKEDLADSAAASLTTTASYIETGASGETATLAAGVEGQLKVFAMTSDGGGNMVITVTNAAWGGSGTITFDTVGDGCTLMYLNSKWCCIGNNGAAFA